jgi:hypothetical protein
MDSPRLGLRGMSFLDSPIAKTYLTLDQIEQLQASLECELASKEAPSQEDAKKMQCAIMAQKIRQRYKDLLDSFISNMNAWLGAAPDIFSGLDPGNHLIAIFDVEDTALFSYQTIKALYPLIQFPEERRLYLPAIPQILKLSFSLLNKGINIYFVGSGPESPEGGGYGRLIKSLSAGGYGFVEESMIGLASVEFGKNFAGWKRYSRKVLCWYGYRIVACFDDQKDGLEYDTSRNLMPGFFKIPTVEEAKQVVCNQVKRQSI